jgi:hypothetical protein
MHLRVLQNYKQNYRKPKCKEVKCQKVKNNYQNKEKLNDKSILIY